MCFDNISGCNLIGLASSTAIVISKDLSSDEISLLGAFFTSLGDNLALIAASQATSCPTIKEENNTTL